MAFVEERRVRSLSITNAEAVEHREAVEPVTHGLSAEPTIQQGQFLIETLRRVGAPPPAAAGRSRFSLSSGSRPGVRSARQHLGGRISRPGSSSPPIYINPDDALSRYPAANRRGTPRAHLIRGQRKNRADRQPGSPFDLQLALARSSSPVLVAPPRAASPKISSPRAFFRPRVGRRPHLQLTKTAPTLDQAGAQSRSRGFLRLRTPACWSCSS